MDFTKADIEQIRISVESEGQSALSMRMHKDGLINRQGTGTNGTNEQSPLRRK